MSESLLSPAQRTALLATLSSGGEKATSVVLKALITQRKVPARLRWAPDLCVKRGRDYFLVYVLVSTIFPAYLEKAILRLRAQRFKRTHVVLLARDILTEQGDGSPPVEMAGPIVALTVAERAVEFGCGLMFESNGTVFQVFPQDFEIPPLESSEEETGHIPLWLYRKLAESGSFSPYLNKAFKSFARVYGRATRRSQITNDREVALVRSFAERFARGDRRLYFPVNQLLVLAEFEGARATRARDHFFHTFNNLFLGFLILGSLYSGRARIAEVDGFIADGPSGLHPWECLWFLTCMFHDPAYMAEKFWGTLRFSFGVAQGDAVDDGEMPEAVAKRIRNMWETTFAEARRDLESLYRRTVSRWTPPSQRRGRRDFDGAVQKAYFDGRNTSHSVVSGLRLIQLCQSEDRPQAAAYDPVIALVACEIAALSMMFHDQRCRAILTESGVAPIPFERLPFATLLMFVDALQDDRRDITRSRFRKLGVLREVTVADGLVSANVCLPEVPVRGWAPRIAEYESVMSWINASSKTQFRIDYKTGVG